MKLELGDRVSVGGVVGNIVNIYKDRRIGFIFNRCDSYDVLLSHVPKDQCVLVEKNQDFSSQKNDSTAVNYFEFEKIGIQNGTDREGNKAP